ncbi:hypothetical protein TRFO_38610 [Tritrichomonas foetus]|uniref:Uncharacterized protein n=1 Tax=Tritrichomonas foetus TaxID=1144522 RepID=A0A1J4J841_9EUKA|nr:hypothetical protein TRFO_38610 [Tritrichomonas foetus]|eukprot:OHS95296.1 hypothetical protein TRFO_38610 [Tritrichomonas foetus]
MSILVCFPFFLFIYFYLFISYPSKYPVSMNVRLKHALTFPSIADKAKYYFNLFDKKERNKFPKICLLFRTYLGHLSFLPFMMKSVDILWPEFIGEKVIVLDDSEIWASTFFNDWIVKSEYPDNPKLVNDSFVFKQWGNFYPEKYCSKDSEYVAFLDSDAIFSMKVSHRLLFNRSKANVIISRDYQPQLFPLDKKILNKNVTYNGMINFPFLIKIKDVINCRTYIEGLHHKKISDVLLADRPKWFSQFCIMTTYIFYYANNEYNFVFAEDSYFPIMRTAVHLRYCVQFGYPKKFDINFLSLIVKLIHDAICLALPNDYFNCSLFIKNREFIWIYDTLKWSHINEHYMMTKENEYYNYLHHEILEVSKEL